MNAANRAIVTFAAALVAGSAGCGRRAPASYPAPPVAFAGASSSLKQTVIVPTLDTPLPAGKNVVWCASFAVAWQRLGKDVLKGPVLVSGAREVAARLNAVTDPESDLPAGSFYAAAGRTEQGAIPRIQTDMRARFPSVPPPHFDASGPGALVAYAYLATNAKFAIPYFESRTALGFHAQDGTVTGVGAFGLRKEDESQYHELRKQPAVLLSVPDRKAGDMSTLSEFAVDLCRTGDVQIVAAVIPRQHTLAETLNVLDRKIAESGALHGDKLGSNDTLLVPNMNWRIDHRFKELEGRALLNPGVSGLPIVQAEQETAFRLDRSGAELSSEANFVAASITVNYIFDRPFLLTMKKRGAKAPFFAMWVDNSELLSRPVL